MKRPRPFCMSHSPIRPRSFVSALLCIAGLGLAAPRGHAQEVPGEAAIARLDTALAEAKGASSDARKRLGVRRVIRDAQELIKSRADKPERFPALEFLFRAQQQLIAMDDDPQHRAALMETCRELIKAPDEYAHLKFQADLLLSQAELARKGASAEQRAAALRPVVERYVGTSEGAKVLRVAMVMALELGDVRLVADLREMMARRYAADHEMIQFQRERLGGQVLGAPMVGTFQRSDGRTACLPMDILGRATMVAFWSKEDGGLDFIKGLAAASKEAADELQGRLDFVSINLDDLPDAGESIIRGCGVNWPVLHLPGGREHPIYKAYTQTDPKTMDVTPTGQTALVMSGVGRVRVTEEGTPDFHRYFGAALSNGWSDLEYAMQVAALMAGDFLVHDPLEFDPSQPPELKAAAVGGEVKPLPRTTASVPEEVLAEIQNVLSPPPRRYSMSYSEADAAYARLAKLCRQAIVAHADAPDLWIVRNRLIVAHLGRWKMTGDLAHFEAAVAEARAAMEKGYPEGCEVVARFCLARAALREGGDKSGELIDGYVAGQGGEKAPGAVLATALLLALDVADRMRVEELRERILAQHTEYPMMWAFSTALLDRHHSYWMFQVPFTAGWSYGRREGYFTRRGETEPVERMLSAELQTTGGKVLRIPQDLKKQWTLIAFGQPAPWANKRDDILPPSPQRELHRMLSFAAGRPSQDVEVLFVSFGGDPEVCRSELAANRSPVECQVATLPGGADHPMVQRLGLIDLEHKHNLLLLRQDGRIGGVVTGLGHAGSDALTNTILREDELAVEALIEAGKLEEAKSRILALVPVYDPEAVDERGRKLREPQYNAAQLRARAKVYLALGELDKALADAEALYSITFSESGGMSMRTRELDEAEQLRAAIQQRMQGGK